MSSRGVRKETDTNSRIIRGLIEDDKAFVQSLKVFGNLRNAGGGGGSARNSNIIQTRITDLGDLTPSPFTIDFDVFDSRNLVGNLIQDNTNITYANIPNPLLLHLRLYVRIAINTITLTDLQDTPITITLDSNHATYGSLFPLVVGDFLDFDLTSADQKEVTITQLKKNNEITTGGGGPQAPSFVGNIDTDNHTETSFDVTWDAPKTGDIPINYDVEYSLSPAENQDGSPVIPIATINTTNTQTPITGLTVATPYYIWINAKNSVGESGFSGPIQTITEGTANPGAINFGPTAIAFDKIDINWDQPAGKQFRFDLKRKKTADISFDIQLRDDEIPTAGTTFTHNDTKLEPNTSYDYKLEVRNEFGQLIGTFNGTISTLNLPATQATVTVQGVFIEFTIDPPDGIDIVEVEWNEESDFSGRGGTREKSRLSGNTDPIVERTPRLNKDTLYYTRTRIKKNQIFGPYVNTSPTNVTTVDVNPPQRLRSVDANDISSTGEINMEFRFDNETQDQTSGLRCEVSYRVSGGIGEYTAFETYDFGTKPFGDTGSDQFRYDFNTPFPIGSWQIRFEAFNEAGGTNPRTAITNNT